MWLKAAHSAHCSSWAGTALSLINQRGPFVVWSQERQFDLEEGLAGLEASD